MISVRMPTWPADLAAEVGRIILFTFKVAARAFVRPPVWLEVIREMYRIGVKGMPVLIAVSVFVGSNLALQGYHTLKLLGGQNMVGMFVSVTGIRELAPLIAAMLIGARSGVEITTTLAVMRSTEQIDAIEVMGVNPYWLLVAPRLTAILFILPFLTIFADFFCFLSGYLTAVLQLGVDSASFIEFALDNLTWGDVRISVIKAGAFGVIISMIACYYGFNSEKGPLGVGRAANRAVVMMAVVSTLVNLVLSEVFYG